MIGDGLEGDGIGNMKVGEDLTKDGFDSCLDLLEMMIIISMIMIIIIIMIINLFLELYSFL